MAMGHQGDGGPAYEAANDDDVAEAEIVDEPGDKQ